MAAVDKQRGGTRIRYQPDREMGFWPTPPEVANDAVYWALIPGYGDGAAAGGCPQVRVLEPSAGDGHLIRAVRQHLPHAWVTAVEPSPARAAGLRRARFLHGRRQLRLVDEVIEATLEDYLQQVSRTAMSGGFKPFDLVVMNPPFALPDRPEAWAEHVLSIYHDPYLCAPCGQISAVVPRIVLTGQSRRVRAVRALPHHEVWPCERGAFAAVGAKVSAALLLAQKPLTPTAAGLMLIVGNADLADPSAPQHAEVQFR